MLKPKELSSTYQMRSQVGEKGERERVGRAMIIIQNSSVKGNEQSVNESKFHSSIDVLNFI